MIVALAGGRIVTVCESVAVQPGPFETVTLNVVVEPTETVIACDVAPVDHK